MDVSEVLQTLQKCGIKQVDVHYAGGHDEGGVDSMSITFIDDDVIELDNADIWQLQDDTGPLHMLFSLLTAPVELHGFNGDTAVNGTVTWLASSLDPAELASSLDPVELSTGVRDSVEYHQREQLDQEEYDQLMEDDADLADEYEEDEDGGWDGQPLYVRTVTDFYETDIDDVQVSSHDEVGCTPEVLQQWFTSPIQSLTYQQRQDARMQCTYNKLPIGVVAAGAIPTRATDKELDDVSGL